MIGFSTFITSALMAMHLQGAAPIAGPVAVDVVEVIDGDTIAVQAHIWPGHIVQTRVRLDGVDTPETRRPACEAEREAGYRATEFTRSWLSNHEAVSLHEVRLGSFAGRVIAELKASDTEESLSDALLEAGLASVYGEEGPWCRTSATAPSSAPSQSRPR